MPAQAFPGEPGDEVIPWLDQPPESPHPAANLDHQLVWDELDSWITPAQEFYIVNHYGTPAIDAASWRLDVAGLVARPASLTLDDLKAREHREVEFTLECSGSTGLPFFTGGIGNARWGGTPLAALLDDAGVLDPGTEVVFWGADAGEVTIRDNMGVLGSGSTGTVQPDQTGGQDLTMTEHFARSMSLDEALNPDNLLCYEMNGAPLPPEHGFPVRLITPGWYGVANVKWLSRIEVRSGRFTGRFMARDYVTIREEDRDGETLWTIANVGRLRLKSAPAKVTRHGDRYAVHGAAWGARIAAVEVQIDDGPWEEAQVARHESNPFAWNFWTYPWPQATPGEHTVTSRAFDVDGNVQPPPDDPYLAGKVTFWESNGQITRHVRIPA
jgi:DMSO/TMAO reductase YedYZ molybdopterin-dependent catalytic subunit